MLTPVPKPALAVARGREHRPGRVVASVPERWAVQGPRRFAGPVGEPPRYGRGGVADATLASHGSISSLGLSCCGLNDRTARALVSGLAGIAVMSDEDGQHLPQRQHDRRRGGVSQQIAQFEQVHHRIE